MSGTAVSFDLVAPNYYFLLSAFNIMAFIEKLLMQAGSLGFSQLTEKFAIVYAPLIHSLVLLTILGA